MRKIGHYSVLLYRKCLQVLSENKILSAPIFNVGVEETAAWTEKFTNIADYLAIVDWMINKTGYEDKIFLTHLGFELNPELSFT